MIALRIDNKKDFMTKLLTTGLFDTFDLEEATIESFNTFHIDGHVHKEFYKQDSDYSDEADLPAFSSWEKLRPICFDLIKGKRTPLGFKFVFHADKTLLGQIIASSKASLTPEQVTLGLNVRFSSGEIVITTGTALSVFTLDKSIEKAWDSFIPSFLESHDINVSDYA